MYRFTHILLWAFFVFMPLPFASVATAESLQVHLERYAQFQKSYETEIEKLLAWCETHSLPLEAEKTRTLNSAPQTGDRSFIAILPQKVEMPSALRDEFQAEMRAGKKSSKNATKKKNAKSSGATSSENDSDKKGSKSVQNEWERRFYRLRFRASNQLFKMSQNAMEDGYATFAFELLMRTLEENPDHVVARKIVGYEEVDGQWLTAFEKLQSRKNVYHPKFGWLPEKSVENYENGRRFYRGRWITPEQDAAIHFDIENGWTVETPHFTIVTNHSLPVAVHIGEEVEVLYRVWKQMFLRYFATDAQLKALFNTKGGKLGTASTAIPGGIEAGVGTNGKHRVFFFRNQENYVKYISPRYPQVAQSCGIYIMEDKTSYFFAGENFDRATMLHEVTHQLFNELRPAVRGGRNFDLTKAPNFWIIEGIATYMESLHDEGNYHVIGGFDTERVLAARIRYVKDKFYIPLAELSAFNTTEFQSSPNMAQLYSQSSGLMQFLLHTGGGQYRDGVSDILRDVYTGAGTYHTIPQRLGKTFSELDAEYGAYISRNKEELKKWEME